jgi:hypothetical protein
MRLLLLPSALLFTAACAHTPPSITPRASFDLGCPESQLAQVQIDKRTIGVTGCGKKATYVENCGWTDGYGGRHDCTWVLNARDTGAAGAATAAQ